VAREAGEGSVEKELGNSWRIIFRWRLRAAALAARAIKPSLADTINAALEFDLMPFTAETPLKEINDPCWV
jgi:hypothetical protein